MGWAVVIGCAGDKNNAVQETESLAGTEQSDVGLDTCTGDVCTDNATESVVGDTETGADSAVDTDTGTDPDTSADTASNTDTDTSADTALGTDTDTIADTASGTDTDTVVDTTVDTGTDTVADTDTFATTDTGDDTGSDTEDTGSDTVVDTDTDDSDTATDTVTETEPHSCVLPDLPADLSMLPRNEKLPDLFTFFDGTPVTAKAQWECRRREIQYMASKYLYGPYPFEPDETTGTLSGGNISITCKEGSKTETFSASVSGSGEIMTIDLSLGILPASTKTLSFGSGFEDKIKNLFGLSVMNTNVAIG